MNIFNLTFVVSLFVGVGAAIRSTGSNSFLVGSLGVMLAAVCYFVTAWLAFRLARTPHSAPESGSSRETVHSWLGFLLIFVSPVICWVLVSAAAPQLKHLFGA